MRRPLILAILSLLAAGALLQAQDRKKKDEDAATRSVQGAVSDPDDKIIPGAVVQLKDTKTLQVRSFVTTADGSYRFHGLSTNVDYQLRAESKDMSSPWKTLSVFDGRKVAIINLKVEKKKGP